MDFTKYEYTEHDGLPPNASPGQFFGYAKDGHAFVLRWNDAQGCWAAVGYDVTRTYTGEGERRHPNLLVVLCTGDKADFIVKWATAPWAWE